MAGDLAIEVGRKMGDADNLKEDASADPGQRDQLLTLQVTVAPVNPPQLATQGRPA
jgi:hypothetical protein